MMEQIRVDDLLDPEQLTNQALMRNEGVGGNSENSSTYTMKCNKENKRADDVNAVVFVVQVLRKQEDDGYHPHAGDTVQPHFPILGSNHHASISRCGEAAEVCSLRELHTPFNTSISRVHAASVGKNPNRHHVTGL